MKTSRCVGAALSLAISVLAAGGCEPIITPLEPAPDSVRPEDVLHLTRAAGAVPLPADGITTDTLFARLPRDAASRVVTFETSAGSFLPLPGSRKIEVRAERDPLDDARWVAKAVLRTDTVATTAIVSARVGEFIRYLPVSFVP